MTDLPLWAAVPAALLLVLAGLVTLIGSLGLLRLRDELVQLAVLAAGGFLELRVAGQPLAEDGVEQLLGALGRGDEVLPQLVGHAQAGSLDIADPLEPHAVFERVDQMLLEVMKGGELPGRRLLSTRRAVGVGTGRRVAALSWRLYLGF